jgi:3-ketosteroid 9alpha-monooxygenase subunit B
VSAPPASHDAVLRAHGYHRLRIKAVVEETSDARSFVLHVPDGLRESFRYRPGQFCTFRVQIGDDVHLRSYSMSSAPETDAGLTVTVKRVAGGLVSNWFHDHLAEGDVVELTKPAGVFCPQGTDRPLAALCGGSGVTPVMSILRSVLATTPRSVALFYANRERRSVIFDVALRELSDRHPDRLVVCHHIDAVNGLVDAPAIETFAGGLADADFYICGPTPFMDLVEDTLARLGVDPGRSFVERFLPGIPAPPAHEPGIGDAPADASNAPAEVTVIVGGRTTVLPYRLGDTVLETARRGALRPPFSCEAGNCATCMAMVRQGSAAMRVNNALTPEEVDEGWILTCQAVPSGPAVTVEYEAM